MPRVQRTQSFDMLKAMMTLLVIFHHTAITYGAMGGWYYREVQSGPELQSRLLVFFCTVNQAYFMGLFFLIAGYFTPAAIQRKGFQAFIRDRLIRLGIPLLVFGFLLGPVTIAMARTVHGSEFISTLFSLLRSGAFSRGPLWFAQALLLMSVATALWYALWHAFRSGSVHQVPSAKFLVLGAIATGFAAFVVRLYWPVGREFWGMQLGYFASYIVLFIIGCMAADGRCLETIPEESARRIRRVAWFVLPTLLPLGLLVKQFTIFQADPAGGWNLPAFMYAMWEPLVALGIIVGLLQYAQRRFKILTPMLATLSRRAYCIYIIHPVVLVAISVGARHLQLPPLIKFGLVGVATCFVCYLIAGLLLRIPVVKRIV